MKEYRVALIVLDTVNENILPFLNELKNNGFYPVLVYYGKNEEEKSILQKFIYECKIIILTNNQGRGNGIKVGLKYIKEKYQNNTIIVTLNGDGTHTVLDAIYLCNECMIEKNSFFIGKKENIEKNLANKIENAFTKMFCKINKGETLTNTTTTLRAFSYSMLDFLLTIKGEKDDYETNVIFGCVSHKIKIIEVDVSNKELAIPVEEKINLKKFTNENAEKLKEYETIYFYYIVDYLLFLFLNFFANDHILIANSFGRLISSIFIFNKERATKVELKQAFVQYFYLSLILLVVDIFLLFLFVKYIHIPVFIAKLFTEILYVLLNSGVKEYLKNNIE